MEGEEGEGRHVGKGEPGSWEKMAGRKEAEHVEEEGGKVEGRKGRQGTWEGTCLKL